MTERSREHIVTFQHSFELRNAEGRLPPGTYRVQSEEESIDGLSFLAFRTTSMSMEVPLGASVLQHAAAGESASSEMITVNAGELEHVLELDRNHGLASTAA